MMTEEEKKSAYEAAKARISKATITLATAASTLTPSLSAAQNSAPAPETARVITASPKNTIEITNIKETQNQPAFGSEEWLKNQMQNDRTEHDAQTAKLKPAAAEHENYQEYAQAYAEKNNLRLVLYRLAQANIAETLPKRVSNDDSPFRIGNWGNSSVESSIWGKIHSKMATKELPDTPDQILAHTGKNKRITIETIEKTSDEALAWYGSSVLSQKITLQTYSEKEQQQARENTQNYGTNSYDEYKLNNPVARITIALHEANHMIDDQYSGQFLLNQTPLNAACGNHLTETKSYAVEYLAAAELYTNLKKQGMNTIQINGENRPLENILEMYPNLKETVLEKGFDAKDPASVRNIVEKASAEWHKNRNNIYIKQDASFSAAASQNFAAYTMTEKLELLKNEEQTYNEISEKMLKTAYIGQNTIVDLSSCRDLLDTLDRTQFAKDIRSGQKANTASPDNESNKIDLISYEELNAVNTYLESKGLTTDNAKNQYLTTALKDIARREKNQDTELKNILLSYNSAMTYADGLNEGVWANMRIITNSEGQNFQISDTMLAEAQKKQQQQQQSERITLTTIAPEEMMPTITLGTIEREDISAVMQQDRQAHDSAVITQCTELARPAREQSPPLSPTAIRQMQQQGR